MKSEKWGLFMVEGLMLVGVAIFDICSIKGGDLFLYIVGVRIG